MIVRSLMAEGFMRYQRIELNDLPTGVIALVGDNEAGKTTLGEAVAFALFGRTIRTEDTDPTQAINWDVDVCRTQIGFEVPGGLYKVERLVARTGEFEARLFDGEGNLVAEGARVNEALVRLIGFDFPTFRYSFYVAQGELDLVQREGRDNAKRIVYDMLGITTIERAKQALKGDLRELEERSDTLERDLIVASALHTDALPLREELRRFNEEHTRATTDLAAAKDEAEAAAAELQRAEQARAAQRGRTEALGRLEQALVADVQRQNLLRARGRLQGLDKALGAAVKKAEAAVAGEAKPRKEAAAELEKAERVERSARKLEALVQHRGTELGRAINDEAKDGLPERKKREERVVAREKRSMLLKTLALLLFMAVAVAGFGVAGALNFPKGNPKLVLPGTVHSPRLGMKVENVTVKRGTAVFGGLGGLGLLAAIVTFVLRQKSAGRREDAEAEIGRLEELLSTDRGEQAACKDFALPAMNGLSSALSAVSDPQVKAAFDALKSEAGDLIDRAETPEELLAKARKRVEELERAHREAEPRLRETQRVANACAAALSKVEGALEEAFDEVPAESAPAGEIPGELAAIEAAVEQAVGQATRARIELDATLNLGETAAVADCVRALRDALDQGFASVPVASEGASLRSRYDEQTGLPELLKDREVMPTSDSLRAVLRRERELLDELLGDEAALRAARTEAEEDLRMARQRRSVCQAALDDAVARGERAEAGRKKLSDLERKMGELRQVLDPMRRKVATHARAIGLLEDLVEVMKARFGPGIARYVEIVLPKLTEGRYTKVKIDQDLDIRVYSRERGDYVRLIELSLGTADQLLVALRLGLARALAHSRGLPGGHFLFLDEPLVSSDERREESFLNLLETFDDEFAQIFVSSPRSMPTEGPFSGQLRVSREQPLLTYAAGSPV